MADSNRTGVYFVEETTWGTTPASALQTLRVTGESLGYNVDTIKSNELRSDRNTADLIIAGFSADGGFDFEMSYGTFDGLLEGALWSDWVVDTPAVGSDTLINGTTEKSYSVERAHLDITQYFMFTGMEVNTLNLTLSAGAIVTGSFGFMGKDCTTSTSSGGTGAATAATTTDVMNAMNNVANIKEGGVAVSGIFISDLTVSITNNVRQLKAIGVTGAADMGVGTFDCSGTLKCYFADTSLYTKFLNGTSTSLEFELSDAAGNKYAITFPKIKYSADKINASGSNSDVMEELSWEALYDSTTGGSIKIVRTPA